MFTLRDATFCSRTTGTKRNNIRAACLVVKVQLSGGCVAASVIMTSRRRCVRMMINAAAAVGCVSLTPQIGVLVHAAGRKPSNLHYIDKKEYKLFLIYKEIHGSGCKVIQYMKGFRVYEEMRKYLVIYEEAVVIYNFATAPFWISLYIYEENFVFVALYI
jgi:hypothetical protein